MGLRFSRSIRLFPGVRLNLGLGGASLSVGAPGASVNIGKRGVYGNVGIPGSGLSYRHRLDKPGGRLQSSSDQEYQCTIGIEEDDIVIRDEGGRQVTHDLRGRVIKENIGDVKRIIDMEVETRNKRLEEDIFPKRGQGSGFDVMQKPIQLPGESRGEWMERIGRWRADLANKRDQQLVHSLQNIEWPRETNISCQIEGERVLLDIDLPEIEDIPDFRWKADHRRESMGLKVDRLSVGDRNRRYVRLVAATVRRAVDAVLEGVPSVKEVAVSAYTTRNGTDDYVAVLDATRGGWEGQRAELDDEIALVRMGSKLEMTSTGKLKPQQPVRI